MIKRLLYAIAFLALSSVSAAAACGSGSPPAGTVCAAPATTAGVANYRALADGHIPSGINATKIGGGAVSTTEFDRLDGVTAYGQSIFSTANEAAFKALVNLEIGVDVQAFDTDLTTWSTLSPSANAQSLVTAANYAAMRALLDLEAGTDFYSIAGANAAFQPIDSDLTAIAALTTTAAGRSSLVFADPGVDRVMFWDDSANAAVPIAVADILTEASPAAGDFVVIYGAEGDARKVNWSSLPGAGGGDNVSINSGAITDPNFNDSTPAAASGGVNVTWQVSSSNVSAYLPAVLGKKTIGIPAGAIKCRATNGCATGTFTGTNVEVSVLDFADTADDFGQFTIPMPKSADESAGVDASFTWTTSTASNAVVWTLACVAISDDDVLDTAMGTLQSVTDTVTAANDQMTTSFTATITPGNTWTEGDKLYCQVSRDADNGADTHTGTARLLSVTVRYNINALRDD